MAIIDKPSDYFNTVLYTGNGASSRAITGVGFQPDWVWNKPRTNTNDYQLVDSVRGGGKVISSNLADAEYTAGNTILSFGSDGFTCGDGASVNANGVTYASWNWKAGTSVSGNTTGSGTSKSYTGSVNTTAGFSIIRYTGNGTAGHTIPHHLGVQPRVVICKRLSQNGQWVFGSMALPNQFEQFLELDLTGAAQTSSLRWNNTDPSSSVFTVGSTLDTNANNINIIAYSFAQKQGYSKFGSYTGNGNADGTFVYTGFKPAYVMAKKSSTTSSWGIFDNKRNPYNVVDLRLLANTSGADDQSSDNNIDFLSNGFKFRSSAGWNASATYIYMAFAENPFVTSTGNGSIPACAR